MTSVFLMLKFQKGQWKLEICKDSKELIVKEDTIPLLAFSTQIDLIDFYADIFDKGIRNTDYYTLYNEFSSFFEKYPKIYENKEYFVKSDSCILYKNVNIISVKPCIILDLNGVLIQRNYYKKTFKIRPHANYFIYFLLKHFQVAIWTSARLYNVNSIIKHLFRENYSKLKFIYDQDKSDKSENCFTKDINKVFKEFGELNEKNTVIIEDSILKIALNPISTYFIIKSWDGNLDDDQFHKDSIIYQQLCKKFFIT